MFVFMEFAMKLTTLGCVFVLLHRKHQNGADVAGDVYWKLLETMNDSHILSKRDCLANAIHKKASFVKRKKKKQIRCISMCDI